MRCVATFNTREDARKFSLFLLVKKIEAFVEDDEGSFTVWVYHEDGVQRARDLLDEFQNHRENVDKAIKEKLHLDDQKMHFVQKPQEKEPPSEVFHTEETGSKKAHTGAFTMHPHQVPKILFRAHWTKFFIMICVLLFFVVSYQKSRLKIEYGKDTGFQSITPVSSALLYDYPQAIADIQKLEKMHPGVFAGDVSIEDLTKEEYDLYREINENPFWQGFYAWLLSKEVREQTPYVTFFEKIRTGQIWRLFTPILLHASFFHILFNMLWLWLLGKMMEDNIGWIAYVLFVVVAACVTNTLQYLMTGFSFMGFSGVVCAMAGYIWERKRKAAWELYPIDNKILIFLWIFIFGLLALQIVSFLLQITNLVKLASMRIANTAHISGVFLGMLLAHSRIFQRKS